MKTILLLLLTTVSAYPQYSLDWSTTSGAGGGVSAGGSYSLHGTIAPPEAHGAANAGTLTLDGGYWTFPDISAPLPDLTMSLSGGFAFLEWSAPAFPVVLEYSDDLSLWAPVDPQPASTVWEEPEQSRRFYRLTRPLP